MALPVVSVVGSRKLIATIVADTFLFVFGILGICWLKETSVVLACIPSIVGVTSLFFGLNWGENKRMFAQKNGNGNGNGGTPTVPEPKEEVKP